MGICNRESTSHVLISFTVDLWTLKATSRKGWGEPNQRRKKSNWTRLWTMALLHKPVRIGPYLRAGWCWVHDGRCSTPHPLSYPCGNFSDTSSWTFLRPKGSIGHVFTVCIRTENQNQASFSPFGPHEISVLIELTLGHLRYHLTDVPPQPNSPPDYVFRTDQPPR